MGLLDDLVSSLGGQMAGGRQVGGGPREQAAGSGTSQLMMALLPVVLAMLTQGRGDAPQSERGAGASGNPGDLGGLLGSLLGAGGSGGLGDLLAKCRSAGLGAEADSWVGRGQNQLLPPDGLERVFGRDGVAEIARRAGVSEAEASRGMSQLLPEVVDRVTPDGQEPEFDALTASVDALARRFGVA